jgi:hypothetical protein
MGIMRIPEQVCRGEKSGWYKRYMKRLKNVNSRRLAKYKIENEDDPDPFPENRYRGYTT